MMILRIPSQGAKVESGLKVVKADLERKLVPQGSAVVRHTALPQKGQSSEWIFSEMARMDEELSGHDEWKHGKISGAVYRMFLFAWPNTTGRLLMFALRRWRRPDQDTCLFIRTLCRFQSAASRYFPRGSQDGG